RGSMMLPVSGSPTRNFQVGQVLAAKMRDHERCPASMEELEQWCESAGLRKGGLEGLKSLRYWPQIARNYSIPLHDASMVNLLYMAVYGRPAVKETAYRVMTESRELSNYCQESVRPTHSRRYAEALQNLDVVEALDLVVNAVIADNARSAMRRAAPLEGDGAGVPAYVQLMDVIETQLDA
ncbi:MAG: hypothetical protein ACPG6X_03850, partial [Synechococcus sp.]